MTTEDYLKLYIGQLVIQQAAMQAEIERLKAQDKHTLPTGETPPKAL